MTSKQSGWVMGFSVSLALMLPGSLLPATGASAQSYGGGSSPVIVSPTVGRRTVIVNPAYYPSYPSSTLIINPSRQRATVIVNPSQTGTVIVNPAKRGQTVIVAPSLSPSRCGTSIIGSPIPAPVPVDLYTGRQC
ncbi:hypothetical protein DO97_01665 [Neosynechococcus sphagnicola sy1]|uniref:Uncharacterized protein n=1 Tax=Neosynechococcus sphagnicola sy1 TaxID=1497020 RepID=A0A098TQX0_9CYAN|nr:hypothetical protein [Neosynechococcus sphagnicola]KGF73228.1 hypothetical protein DO97_01665 [Neosynechococcus sphagnicola sy1]